MELDGELIINVENSKVRAWLLEEEDRIETILQAAYEQAHQKADDELEA